MPTADNPAIAMASTSEGSIPEILKTKGYDLRIEKDDLNYEVVDKSGLSTAILYSTNYNGIKKRERAIILSFRDFPIPMGCTLLNLSKKTIKGIENDLTDDLRDFLRKFGIRIFSNRRFRSIPVVMDG